MENKHARCSEKKRKKNYLGRENALFIKDRGSPRVKTLSNPSTKEEIKSSGIKRVTGSAPLLTMMMRSGKSFLQERGSDDS